MATEIAIFPLREGQDPNDANGETTQVLKEIFATLTQQKGFQRAYWGLEHENPITFRLFVDWDSVEAHREFTKQDYYKPFFDRANTIFLTEQGQIFHANLLPHPPDGALSNKVSPATEILTVYFPSNYSVADQKKFEEDFHKLITLIKKDSEGTCTAFSGGWIVEELTIPGTVEKAIAYAGFLGWHSVEAHLKHRTTHSFKQNIHLLREAKDLKHLQVVHSHLTQIDQ